MKPFKLLLLLIILVITSFGKSHVDPNPIKPKTDKPVCWWGQTINDNGIDYSKKCFPGLAQNSTLIDSLHVQIFDRWGTLHFETRNQQEDWICNDSLPCDIREGTYYYLIYYFSQYLTSMDTIDGRFVVFNRTLK
jgi:CHU_C Type IX secretion signal domain